MPNDIENKIVANDSKFIYTINIKAPTKRLWDALTKPEITRKYWGHENISSWKEGAEWHHIADDQNRTIKLVGKIIKAIPNRLLVLTWADPAYINNTSTVKIEIEPIGTYTRLKIMHNNFKNCPKMFNMIQSGWLRVLSSMKSFLETGNPIITWNH
jgi:uncharacterized protein YndB with AHSA1/START domain